MSGFFTVTDFPERRVVQYKRVSSSENAVYVEDEKVLGDPVNEMPYAYKTGLAVTASYFGMVYEVPYLDGAGNVYFSLQPVDGKVGSTLKAEVKAGTAPYSVKWYKDDMQVVNIPDSSLSLKVLEAGKYFLTVTDANGVQAVSKAAVVSAAE